ncbi:MAG: DUF2442 domain-containing protein [Dechloromonas sp.]|nr:MAG: DUF2442 domain-containing protein [Dechloromonas sp.]
MAITVSVLPDFKLAVTFCDGSSGVVDCSSIQNSANPHLRTLGHPEYFASEAGTWRSQVDGADLDPSWLHAELANKTWSVLLARLAFGSQPLPYKKTPCYPCFRITLCPLDDRR